MMNLRGQGIVGILILLIIAAFAGVFIYNFATGQKIVSQGCTTLAGLTGFVNAQGFCEAIPFQAAGGGGVPTGQTGAANLSVAIADEKDNSALNGTVDFYTGGILFASASGTTAAIINLNPSTVYTGIVRDPSAAGNTYFYSKEQSFVSPSAGTIGAIATVKSINTGALQTNTCYLTDDLTANTKAAPQAITSNESITNRCRIRTASSVNDNNVFSNGMIKPEVVCDANSQNVIAMQFKEGGVSLLNGIVPTGHSTVAVAGDYNRNTSFAFQLASANLRPSTDYDFYITVKAGAVNPIASSDSNAAIHCVVYDAALVRNTMTNTYQNVYRNPNTLADVGATNYAFDIWYS